MHITKKAFWSLPPVWHGTTFWKKQYRNLLYIITYWTIFTADLIISLVLKTNVIHEIRAPQQNCSSFTKLSSKDKTLFLRVTSEYTVSSFKVRLYLTDSLIILLAPMWDNSMIITMLHESGFLTDLQRSAWHKNQPHCVYVSPVYPLSNSSSSSIFRDGSRTAATSKMERFVIMV